MGSLTILGVFYEVLYKKRAHRAPSCHFFGTTLAQSAHILQVGQTWPFMEHPTQVPSCMATWQAGQSIFCIKERERGVLQHKTPERDDTYCLVQVFLRHGPDLFIVHITFDKVLIHIKFVAFDDAWFVAEVGTDDDGKFQVLVLPMLQYGKPIHLWHQQIEEQKIRRIFVDEIEGLLPILRSAHTSAMLAEGDLHHVEEERLVFSDDDVLALLVHCVGGREESDGGLAS